MTRDFFMNWRIRKNNTGPLKPALSIIDQECSFDGQITFTGTLVVNGNLRGKLITSDTLIVGETGEVQANLQTGTVISAGRITGSINARERIEFQATAHISGDLFTPVLVVERGAFFDGNCKTTKKETQILQMKVQEEKLPPKEPPSRFNRRLYG